MTNEEARELYEEGASLQAVGLEINAMSGSPDKIARRAIVAAGGTIRPRGRNGAPGRRSPVTDPKVQRPTGVHGATRTGRRRRARY